MTNSIEASSLTLAIAHLGEAVKHMENGTTPESQEKAFGHARKARQLVGSVVRSMAPDQADE